jgi:hypothetical protein
MALAVTCNFTVTDSKGKSSLTKVRVPTGFSISQYGEFAEAMAQLIANMQDGAITEVTVGLPVSLSGATIRATAIGIADVAKKLFLNVRSAVSGLFGKFNIPTYNEVNTVSGSDAADIVDPDIAALIAIVENGINVSGETIQPIDLRGNDLADVVEAREIFRKSG